MAVVLKSWSLFWVLAPAYGEIHLGSSVEARAHPQSALALKPDSDVAKRLLAGLGE